MSKQPFVVEVLRGQIAESRHRGSAIAVDCNGTVLLEIGDLSTKIYPRSAIKPFQALHLFETGAVRAFNVEQTEIAVACASHSAESFHTEIVDAWLERLELTAEALACGPHAPLHRQTKLEMIRSGNRPRRVHNNCSGKHVGMLTTIRHLGEPISGYLDADHPLQRRVKATLEALFGETLNLEPGIDGCGAPNWPVSLPGLAMAASRLAAAQGTSRANSAALEQIGDAMIGHPQLVAGSGRCCTDIMSNCPGVLAKTGAEGVYMLGHRPTGIGIALKIEDGATRAAETFAIGLLRHIGLIDESQAATLRTHFEPDLRNFAGQEVGRIRLAADWRDG